MGFMSLAGPVTLRQGPPKLAQLPGWNPGGSPAFIAQEQAAPAAVPAAVPPPFVPPPLLGLGGPLLVLLGVGLAPFVLATLLSGNK